MKRQEYQIPLSKKTVFNSEFTETAIILSRALYVLISRQLFENTDFLKNHTEI